MFVFIMSPNGFGAALYSTVSQLTLLFRAAAARIKSQSPIIFLCIKRYISLNQRTHFLKLTLIFLQFHRIFRQIETNDNPSMAQEGEKYFLVLHYMPPSLYHILMMRIEE